MWTKFGDDTSKCSWVIVRQTNRDKPSNEHICNLFRNLASNNMDFMAPREYLPYIALVRWPQWQSMPSAAVCVLTLDYVSNIFKGRVPWCVLLEKEYDHNARQPFVSWLRPYQFDSDPFDKFYNALDKYPTIYHLVTRKCTKGKDFGQLFWYSLYQLYKFTTIFQLRSFRTTN